MKNEINHELYIYDAMRLIDDIYFLNLYDITKVKKGKDEFVIINFFCGEGPIELPLETWKVLNLPDEGDAEVLKDALFLQYDLIQKKEKRNSIINDLL